MLSAYASGFFGGDPMNYGEETGAALVSLEGDHGFARHMVKTLFQRAIPGP